MKRGFRRRSLHGRQRSGYPVCMFMDAGRAATDMLVEYASSMSVVYHNGTPGCNDDNLLFSQLNDATECCSRRARTQFFSWFHNSLVFHFRTILSRALTGGVVGELRQDASEEAGTCTRRSFGTNGDSLEAGGLIGQSWLYGPINFSSACTGTTSCLLLTRDNNIINRPMTWGIQADLSIPVMMTARLKSQ